jgi:hypothetical protein
MLEIREAAFRFIDARYPTVRSARSGDPRSSTASGLQELFSANNEFEALRGPSRIELQLRGSPEDVWNLMKDMYFIGMLPETERQELRSEFISLAQDRSHQDGAVPITFPMQIFQISRSRT